MSLLLFIGFAYLLGSIPFGLIVGKIIKGIDIREYGSKNIGATNVFRVIGKAWGIFVFFMDALKGSLAVAFPGMLVPEFRGAGYQLLFGVIAILAHSFPIWLRFRGGKGVASSLGVFVTICPKPALLTFALWLIVFLLSRILSLASLVAAVFFPVMVFLTSWSTSSFPYLFPVSILTACFIFYTHRANISRLVRGEEKRLF